jgi:hypothetical protein
MAEDHPIDLSNLPEEASLTEPAAAGSELSRVQRWLDLASPPSSARVYDLLEVLGNLVLTLNDLAAQTLEHLPESNLDVGDPREAMRQFLAGNDDPAQYAQAISQLHEELDGSRRTLVALIACHAGKEAKARKDVINSAGRQFATWFLDNFSPARMEDIAGSEWRIGERCWKQYKDRFNHELSAAAIERQVKDAAIRVAEQFFSLGK